MTKIASPGPMVSVTPPAPPPVTANSTRSTAEPAVQAKASVDLSVPKSNLPKVDPQQMRQQLQEAIERLNDEMKKSSQELRFAVDDVLDFPVVTVRNIHTGDVVRQIPNETTVRIAHNVEKLKGLLFNNKA